MNHISMPAGVPNQDDGYVQMLRNLDDENGIDWEDPIWWPFHCECHGQRFKKRADLSRHLNKERHRFMCTVANCPSAPPNGPPPCFGTLNDKKRHYRDVHGMDLDGNPLSRFYCPWVYCKRHTDGFPRQKNLDNHLRSLHDGQRPAPAPTTDAHPEAIAAHHPATPHPIATNTDPAPASTTYATAAAAAHPRTTALANLDPAILPAMPSATSSASSSSQPNGPADDSNADAVLFQYEQDLSSLHKEFQDLESQVERMQRRCLQIRTVEEDLQNRMLGRREFLRKRRAATAATRK